MKDYTPELHACEVWAEAWQLHVQDIGIQHRRLDTLAGALRDSIRAGSSRKIERSLEAFVQYVQLHFSDEEQFMMQIGFPGIEQHRLEHRDFTARCEQLRDAMRRGEMRPSDEHCEALLAWLDEHAVREDRLYLSYCRPVDTE